MFRKVFPVWLIAGSIALAIGITFWALPAVQALADCGDPLTKSSCLTCHETAKPVYDQGEWHTVHARKDICWNCHGGNTQAQDADSAHVGLIAQPLEDTHLSCYACHPDDYPVRAGQFASVLGVTAHSIEPTARPTEEPTPGSGVLVVQLNSPSPVNALLPLAWHWLIMVAIGAFFLGLGIRGSRLSHQ